MNELIKIEEAVISNEKVNAVSARELHKVLGVGRDFSTWLKSRVTDSNFTEGRDYLFIPQTGENSSRGRPTKEYYLSLDMAKHLCMLERTPQGHQVREYFIECEKKLQQALKPKQQCFLEIIEAIEAQATEITQAKPKVSYYDIILQSEDLMSITEIAKDYGISAVRLNKILESESVQYKYHKDWSLYHYYKTQGLTATTTHRVKQGYVKVTLKWNQKGRLFIHDLLKSLNIFATMDEEKIPSEPLSHKSFRYVYRNTKTDKPFEKWVDEYRKDLVPKKDYELSPITLPNSQVTMVDWMLT